MADTENNESNKEEKEGDEKDDTLRKRRNAIWKRQRYRTHTVSLLHEIIFFIISTNHSLTFPIQCQSHARPQEDREDSGQ